jgi:hypothetical protein
MRIAISGTHRSGKSTLFEELAGLLPKYATVDEPYRLMEEEGYEFSHPPSLEDFQAQLARSIESLSDGGRDVLFDRCPLDILAYISAHEDEDAFAIDEWLPRVRAAMRTLTLIVFVPVERRDRIAFSSSDDEEKTRATIDEKLMELLLDDPFELDVEVLVVEGDLPRRARTVMQRVRQEC